MARDTDVSHALWTIGRADAACDIVEAFSTLRIPECTPLFAIITLVNRASPSAIRVRLVAVGPIVSECTRAVLPADWANSIVAISAEWIAESSVLFFVAWAGGDSFASPTAVRLFPAASRGVVAITCDWSNGNGDEGCQVLSGGIELFVAPIGFEGRKIFGDIGEPKDEMFANNLG